MFLYHLNFGWPYVDEGTEFVAPISAHLWQSDSIAEQGVSYRVLPAPQRGFVEQVTEHALVADRDGTHRVALISADGSRGVEVAWDATAMPNFFEWQNLRDGAYAVGLEPSTNHVLGESAAREDGTLTWLEHGERRDYRTSIRVLDGVGATAATRQAIRDIAGQPH
jgi:hypothetical protein